MVCCSISWGHKDLTQEWSSTVTLNSNIYSGMTQSFITLMFFFSYSIIVAECKILSKMIKNIWYLLEKCLFTFYVNTHLKYLNLSIAYKISYVQYASWFWWQQYKIIESVSSYVNFFLFQLCYKKWTKWIFKKLSLETWWIDFFVF